MAKQRIYKDKETARKAKNRWINNYNKETYKAYTFRFKVSEEKEVIDKLESIELKSQYIRDLILKDIKGE